MKRKQGGVSNKKLFNTGQTNREKHADVRVRKVPDLTFKDWRERGSGRNWSVWCLLGLCGKTEG